MDIFSATSKQVETATTPKVQAPIETRQVEQSNEAPKSARESNKQNEEDVKEMVKLGATSVYFSEGFVKGARVSLRGRFGDDSI